MSGKNKKSDGDGDRFERRRRNAVRKRRITLQLHDVDDMDADDIVDCAFIEPTNEDLEAIEEEGEEGKT